MLALLICLEVTREELALSCILIRLLHSIGGASGGQLLLITEESLEVPDLDCLESSFASIGVVYLQASRLVSLEGVFTLL